MICGSALHDCAGAQPDAGGARPPGRTGRSLQTLCRWTLGKPLSRKEHHQAQAHKRAEAGGGASPHGAAAPPTQSLLPQLWVAGHTGVAAAAALAAAVAAVVAEPVQGGGVHRLLAGSACLGGARHLPAVGARTQSCGSNRHRSLSYNQLSHPTAVPAPVAVLRGKTQATLALWRQTQRLLKR